MSANAEMLAVDDVDIAMLSAAQARHSMPVHHDWDACA